MGNVHSENQICDCKTRSGSKAGHGTQLTEKVTVSERNVEDGKGGRGRPGGGRVRSFSLGENKVEVGRGEAVEVISHGYNLRPRNKDGSKALGKRSDHQLNEIRNNVKPVPVTTSPKYSRIRYSSTDNELLLLSLEKLSLVNTTINPHDDKQASGGSSITSPRESDMELPKHVLYYGWFFSPEVSTVIHTAVMHFFQLCYTQVPQFQRFMSTCCKDADIRDPFEYYKRPGKRVKPDNPLEYHITAKFLGRDPDPPYQSMMHPFLQKTFRIHLIGLVFTPRTLGVRVKLTPAQQLVFDEKDDSRSGRKLSNGPSDINVDDIRTQIQEEIDGYKYLHKTHKKAYSNCKLKIKASAEGKDVIIFKRCQFPDPTTNTTTSRAHITIGCAPNVKPKKTGDDLVDVIDLEQRSGSTGSSNFQQDFKIERGILRQFGRHADAFVLYSDTEMIVPGQFNLFI